MKTPPQPKAPRARVMFADMQTESTPSFLTLHRFKARIEEHADAYGSPCKPVAFSVLPRSKEAQEGMILEGARAGHAQFSGETWSAASMAAQYDWKRIARAVLASANLVEKPASPAKTTKRKEQ